MIKPVSIQPTPAGPITIGPGAPLLLMAGPCVLESGDLAWEIAREMKAIAARLGVSYVFKASFDKANRTSLSSFRGPGAEKGLRILGRLRAEVGVPVVSDIHEPGQAELAADCLDILQIPAFLCRQTDLLMAAARTGKVVNVKKGQFVSPWDMEHAVNKLRGAGTEKILLTERGASFGYNNLVVDMRSLVVMRAFGYPVVFDATHSVQLPGGAGGSSGGQREFIPALARAAMAVGIDGLFLEVHPQPDKALCDGPNSLPLDQVEPLLKQLLAVRQAVSGVIDAA
ncbi:2-dehydro-3-deoxyphosphooctonate aldolase [Desulfobulbus propionicus DSM 2032]|uniref:2-dehydro-3-deoxyphosphooctonate aldolase n=1 Tax=Desulfobulbus propionicus (strain ATCC 33891 / DSM 2032 / VKM B-1956 / 1pr3) TaxID=577650 RepID=A0A7U4DQV7_DESPD|nr:3-deoxy-8-phosphooctulonate synthase [Desulfobulbus propionicus]ADW19447.1 2-dehydro-3-deoxyphosphooctonate aldolase [Desulfobulbus propionicus DSM 2032]